MKKEVFVTAGMCRIKDQFADTARNMADEPVDAEEKKPSGPVSVFDGLSEETARALRERVREYEHFRQDLTFRLHEFASRTDSQSAELEKTAEVLRQARSRAAALLEKAERQTPPDEYSEDFQLRLSDNCRELERLRIELIDLHGQLPETTAAQPQSAERNLFADLDSITFGQLFRIGAAMMLPLILAMVFGGILLTLAIFLTFRVNL